MLSEFKYLIFLFTLVIFVPFAIFLCRFSKQFIYYVFAIAIFATVFSAQTTITFLPEEWYKTATWGFNITLTDLCLLVLFFSMLMRPHEYKIRWFVPLTIPFMLYFAFGFISWLFTSNLELGNPMATDVKSMTYKLWLFPLFELWKIIRFYFAIFVLTNFIASAKALKTVLISFSVILVYVTFKALSERYLYKIHAVSAGFAHFHMFNAYAGMLGAFLFPFAIASECLMKRIWFLFLVLCSWVDIILTQGRSALAAYGVSLFGATSFLFFHGFLRRRMLLLSMLILLSFALLGKGAQTLSQRFNLESIEESAGGRGELNAHAIEMANEHPFGVGLGNYSAWYVAKYAGTGEEDVSIAHNILFLNLGEIGYPGFIAFFFIYLRVFQMAFINFFRCWKIPHLSILLIAAIASFMVLFMQDMFHFTSRNNSLAFIMQIMIAFISRIYIDKEGMRAIDVQGYLRS